MIGIRSNYNFQKRSYHAQQLVLLKQAYQKCGTNMEARGPIPRGIGRYVLSHLGVPTNDLAIGLAFA